MTASVEFATQNLILIELNLFKHINRNLETFYAHLNQVQSTENSLNSTKIRTI